MKDTKTATKYWLEINDAARKYIEYGFLTSNNFIITEEKVVRPQKITIKFSMMLNSKNNEK